MATNPHAEAVDFIIVDESCSSYEHDGERELEVENPGNVTHKGLREMGVTNVPRFHQKPSPMDGKRSRESPRVRTIAYLIAQGHSQKEVAELVGVGNETVCIQMQQRHVQEMVAYFLEQAGADPLRKLFAGAAQDAFYNLAKMQLDDKVPPSVRAKIGTDFLNRVYGTPTATVVHEHKNVSTDPKADADQLLEELEKINAAKREALERQQKQQNTEHHATSESTANSGPDFGQC